MPTILPDCSIYYEEIELPGMEKVPPAILTDGVTEAERLLKLSGATYAYQCCHEELAWMIARKTWRSPAAAEMLIRLQRLTMHENRIVVTERCPI